MTQYAVQPAYVERHPAAVPGMIDDMVQRNVITRICETAAGIGFGLAVGQGVADKGSVIGGLVGKFLGITTRDITLIHPTPDLYYQRDSMGVLTLGQIWVAAGSNVVANDPVYYNPISGAFSNAVGAPTVGAPSFAGTGNGVLTRATPAYGTGIKVGNYRAVAIEPGTDSGRFMVFDPEGNEIGQAIVGTPFVGPVRFTIADGATDFAANDEFTLGVTVAAEGPILGARWVDTALASVVARISLGIQK